MEEQKTEDRSPRALALDALRGLAILMMCLSGRVPFDVNNALPAWMYHAQETVGGPHGLPGYTWVDLVFPLFLFSMGVAFPFAQSSRLKKGATELQVIGGALLRGILLALFAIYFSHIGPDSIDATATIRRLAGLFGVELEAAYAAPAFTGLALGFLGFLILIPVYTRLPAGWKPSTTIAIRTAGIIAAILLLSILRYPEGSRGGAGFSVYRSNIILLVLANMAFLGTTVWVLTRRTPLLRLGFLVLFYPLYEASKIDGSELHFLLAMPFEIVHIWMHWLFDGTRIGHALFGSLAPNFFRFDWLYSANFLKYLFIVIPGTMVGEQLMAWMKSLREPRDRAPHWNRRQLLTLSLIAVGLVVFVHITLQARWLFAGTFIPIGACVILLVLTQDAANGTERFLRELVRWGSFWLLIGIFFEPVDGGIRKTPSNMSYYFVSLGLSILLLLAFTVWIDLLRKERWFRVVIDNGQNPMLAYVGINNLMEPLVYAAMPLLAVLTGAGMKLTGAFASISMPWYLFCWAVFKTALLALLVSALTRLKIVWRT